MVMADKEGGQLGALRSIRNKSMNNNFDKEAFHYRDMSDWAL